MEEFLNEQFQEWKNIERRRFLCAGMPESFKISEPDAFEDKFSFWLVALEKTLQNLERVSFSEKELETLFPSSFCMDALMKEMIDQKLLISQKSLGANNTISSTLWSVCQTLYNAAASWNQTTKSKLEPGHKYAFVPILKHVADDLEAYFKEKHEEGSDVFANTLYISYAQLFPQNISKNHDVSNKSWIRNFKDEELNLVLGWMANSNRIQIITDSNQIIGIKWNLSHKYNQISEEDTAIINLKTSLESAEKSIQTWEKEVENCIFEAKMKIKSGNKLSALHLLKKKRLYENQLKHLRNAAANITQVLLTIQNAAQTVSVFNALKVGNNALKQLNSNMNEETIDSLMDDVREEIEKHNEISNVISQDNGYSDIDIEEELNQLELESETTNATQKPEDSSTIAMLGQLPNVDDLPALESELEELAIASAKKEEMAI